MKKRSRILTTLLFGAVLIFLSSCGKDEEHYQPAGTVTDIDGNVYHTVAIGSQVWMVEDLMTTRFNDGSPIPLVKDAADWGSLTSAGYCWYYNSITYKGTFGALYNWHAVNTGKLAPKGWHVPTDADWKKLEMSLGMSQAQADTTGWWRGTNEGGQLKEVGTAHWLPPNIGATNSSGFTALPGGERYGTDGTFHGIGDYGAWWTASEFDSTNAWNRCLSHDIGAAAHRGNDIKDFGFSVRCVRD